MQLRPARQADGGNADDHEHGDDQIPGRLPQRVDAEGRAEVVRHEDGREGDHDQVVEEERPAGQEPEDVVVGAADERRRASRLRDRRRSLGVGERDDQEEDPCAEEDERRQAERVRRNDPEREVERRGDLAVRDRKQRRRVENRHAGSREPCVAISDPLAAAASAGRRRAR